MKRSNSEIGSFTRISRLKILILVFLISLWSSRSETSARQNHGAETLIQDTVSAVKAESKHHIYAIGGLGYNLIYLGSSLSQDKPYYSGGIIYGFNKEIFASVNAVHLSIYDPLLTFSTFSLNYTHTFNSWFDIAAGISRYQVPNSLTDTLFDSFIYADVTLGFDWKLLYSKFSVGGFFSETGTVYFQLRNSRYFETGEFLKGKAYFSFDPYFNLLFGTVTETSEGKIVAPPYKKGKGKGSVSSTTSTFGLMEADMGIPVSFDIGRFTIEAEPGYSIPFYKNAGLTGSGGFVFTLGCFIRIL